MNTHTCSYSTPLVQTFSPTFYTAVWMCVWHGDLCLEKRDRVNQVTVRRVFLSLRPYGKCGARLCVDASKCVTCQILPNAMSLLKWPVLFRLRKRLHLIRNDCLFEEPSITEQSVLRTFIILRDNLCHIHLALKSAFVISGHIGFQEYK